MARYSTAQIVFQTAVCEALGLDPRVVLGLSFVIAPGSALAVQATLMPNERQLEELTAIVREYKFEVVGEAELVG